MERTGSGAQMQPDDAAQIRATIDPWNRCCVERDWDTLLTMCTDDVVFSGPGENKVSGDALRTWLDNFPVQKAISWDFDRPEVSGSLAAGSGSGSMTLEVDGQEVTSNFDFTDVLRKDAQGRWLYSSVIFNENEPSA